VVIACVICFFCVHTVSKGKHCAPMRTRAHACSSLFVIISKSVFLCMRRTFKGWTAVHDDANMCTQMDICLYSDTVRIAPWLYLSSSFAEAVYVCARTHTYAHTHTHTYIHIQREREGEREERREKRNSACSHTHTHAHTRGKSQ
jgi:hypothetical protein